jgi:DNA polymerase
MSDERTRAARELLAFYMEAGLGDLVDETPVDRLAPEAATQRIQGEALVPETQSAPVPSLRPTLAGRPEPPPPAPAVRAVSPEAAAMAAREAARTAQTLDELRAMLEAFEGCALKSMAKQLVFADGNPEGRLMFVGEAPGREEDLEGRPFVGPSGRLLDRMLKAIGLDRSAVYIANVVPWRPPGNRTPTPQETAICLPFIRRQIELANPDVLVCLGGPAMQTLLSVKDGIRKMRGRWVPYDTGTREIRVLPTYHPAYLLRSPLEKRSVWRDFLAIKRALAE